LLLEELMHSEIIRLDEFSGEAASFYSVNYNGSKDSLFDEFRDKYFNIRKYRKNMGTTILQISQLGSSFGAVDRFFEPNDPFPADRVCYLHLRNWPKIRLFCIRFSKNLVVIGSGGLIDQTSTVNREKNKMSHISELITIKMHHGDLRITHDGKNFMGNFEL
jgi:hypothetical protein